MQSYATLIGANGLEESLQGITTNIIIRNETKQHYVALPTINALHYAINSGDILHEVIYGNRPQRIKIDWDGVATTSMPHIIRDEIITAIVLEFTASYMIEACAIISAADIMVMNSNSDTKTSFHFIVAPNRFVVSSAHEAREFVTRVCSRCSPETANQFDLGVYKSLQNFRVLGCTKNGRCKIYENSTGNTLDELSLSLVGHFDTTTVQLLPDLCKQAATTAAPVIIVEATEMHTALQLATTAGFTVGFIVRQISNNFIVFTRVAPSYCSICSDTHHKDNTLMVFVMDVINDADMLCRNAFAKCRHAPKGSNVFLGAVTNNVQIVDKFIWRADRYAATTDKTTLINDRIVYDNPVMQPLQMDARTLFVRAAMGVGKSKALKAGLQLHYANTDKRIILVTFRQTFAAETLSKLQQDGFELYSDQASGILTQQRLIIQVESLHRLSHDQVDLLILDECESIFGQLNSGLGINNASSFANFIWSLQYASNVICMDALLGSRTYNIITNIRGAHGLQLHDNTYKPAAADTYHITLNINCFMDQLCNEIKSGKNIFIPTNSLVAANTINDQLKATFPHLSVGLYTKNTPQTIKKEHFSNVNAFWASYRVVIITPTVSAGVSFERDHFNAVFGYFIDCSCPVETCIQMMGRVRSVSTKSYTLFMGSIPIQLPTTEIEIMDAIINRRHSVNIDNRTTINDCATVYITANGRVQIKKSDYWHVWVENKIMINLSRKDFIGRLLWRLRCSGATIAALDNNGNNTDFKSFKSGVKSREAQHISDSVDLSVESAEKIIKDIRDQQTDVSVVDRQSIEKYKFRAFYNIRGDITPELLCTYNTSVVKNQYRNVQFIIQVRDNPTDAAAAFAVLESVRSMEQLRYATLPDMVQIRINAANNRMPDYHSYLDILDLNYHYNYDKHRIAFILISQCGWSTLYDTKSIVEIDIKNALEVNANYFKSLKSEICQLYEVSWIANNAALTYKTIINAINQVINNVYGASINSHVKVVLRYYTITHKTWPC